MANSNEFETSVMRLRSSNLMDKEIEVRELLNYKIKH